MAKDGTNRGGRRVRAGDKPKPLAEKILAGENAEVLDFRTAEFEADDLETADLEGVDMPAPDAYLSAHQKNGGFFMVEDNFFEPDAYLSAHQKNGKPLGADEIYKETWLWLKNRGCEKLVNKRLLESYAQAFARFIQCENALSDYGLIGKHPTTGGAIASPFVAMSQTFQKQANLIWYEIYDIVKQNCTTQFDGSPQEDMMEQLLRSRKG